MSIKYKAVFLLAAILILLPLHIALADTGPKPTMDFDFVQDFPGPQVSITSGTLYECDQADCSDAAPLRQLGPQRFTCEPTHCRSMAYGYSTYHQIEIQFSDGKTRRSNIFQTAGFNASYKVTIRADDLLVEPQLTLDMFSPAWIFALACACLLCLTVLALLVVVWIVRRAARKQ